MEPSQPRPHHADLSIKDVPEDVAEALRQRAARNHGSLQGELMATCAGNVGFFLTPMQWPILSIRRFEAE